MQRRPKSVGSKIFNHFNRPQRSRARSQNRVLGDAVKSLVEALEFRRLLSATGIGINFTGGGNGAAVSMNPPDTAGVFPIANYNNESGGSQTGVTLNDSNGNTTPVTLTYTSGGTWNSTGNTPATGDQELNNGFVFTNGTTPADFQLTGIPYADYDVYVYELNDGAGRVETTTDINTGVSVVGSSPNPTDANHESGTVNNFQYIAATGTTSSPTANADFAEFSGNTPNFEFQAFAPGNGYINGIEIVDHTTTSPTLNAATPGNGAVALSWTYGNAQSQSNSFTYTVYRSTGAQTPVAIATGLTTQSYTDTTAANNTAYTYYVVANNGIGPSASSNTLTATPVAGAPPAPTGITATRTGASTVAIAFNSALGAASYDVERGTALNGNGTLGGTITDITPGGTTQTSVTDSSAPASAYYAVTASNTAGTSPASVVVFVNSGDGWQASYYSSSTAGTAVYDGDQTAGVAYTQPDGTAVPTTVPQPPATNSPPSNSAVLGFQRNEATPIDDIGANGVEYGVTTPPPNAPSNFNSIEGGNVAQDMAARWVGYIEAPYTGYYTFNPTSDDGVAITVFDTTHLTNGQPTPVTLQPDNIFLGRGPATDSDPVVDSTGAPVEWIAGQKYLVQMDYQNQGGPWQAILSYSVSSTAANQTSGTYDILPKTLIPVSQVLAPIPTFQTVDAANPGGLANDNSYYTISAVGGNNSAQLTFSNIGADSYNIYRSTSPTGPFTTPIANIPETNGQAVTFIDTGLTNGTTYYYVVTGVDDSGQTPIASGLTTSVTPVGQAPAAPTNLQATRVSANNVALTWSPSTFATSYDVKRGTALNADGTLGGTITDVTPGGTTSTSATDTNAFQRTTYYYEVTATNGGGTSAPSNIATVTYTYSFDGLPNAISVNFTGGGNGGSPAVSMAPGDTAGVVEEPNYNNVGYNTAAGGGSGVALNDSTGAATAATLTFTAGGNYSTVGGTTFTPANGDQELNDGFVYGTSEVEVNNIPYANYDVYIYELNDAAGRVEETVDLNTGQTVYGSSANPTDANHESGTPNTYQYVQSTDTTGAGTPNGDYVLFTGQNGGTFEFYDTAPGNGYLTGFEIVDDPTAAPTTAPVLNPATAGNQSVALSWNSVPDASSYTVYRTDPAHPTPAIVATNITSTTYTDNSVTNGVTYTYTVGADDTVGEAPLSNSVTATPIAPPVVTSITPTSGPATGGTTVTINGTGFTGATAVDFGTTPASSFIVNSTGTQITAVDPAGTGTVDVTVVTAGGTSATSAADKFTYTVSTVTISSVVVNGNNSALAGVQRSMVNSIVYTFGQAVILNQTNAFSIALHSGQSGTLPTLTWTAVNPDASGGSTQWVVTFSGAGVSGGSIANGVYDITLNAAGVSGESGGTLASSRTDTFYRLFGDAQGTKNVSTADYNAFLSTNGLKSTAPGYLAEFAADGSGKIDTSDYNAFLADLGKKLTGFTPTI